MESGDVVPEVGSTSELREPECAIALLRTQISRKLKLTPPSILLAVSAAMPS